MTIAWVDGKIQKTTPQDDLVETCSAEDMVNRLNGRLDGLIKSKVEVNETIADITAITADKDIPVDYEHVPEELTGDFGASLKDTVTIK